MRLRNARRATFILGFLPSHNRVYLADKDVNVFAYSLSLDLIEYQTAVLRDDMNLAESILPSIPKEQKSKVARFLEARGQSAVHSSRYQTQCR
jgi:coatomer subunit beta'